VYADTPADIAPARPQAADQRPASAPVTNASVARPIPVSFVISGGASLGAYEAGVLHYLVESMKLSPGVFDIKIATGASAGSINGVLTLLAACSASELDPRASLFFATWAGLGFPALAPTGKKSPIALLSRSAMEAIPARIKTRFESGLRESCDVVLGVSTTRLSPKREALAPDSPLALLRAEEKFVVRLRGRGAGNMPLIENYVDQTYGFPQIMLPLQMNAAPFDALRDLLYASSAFPFAFDPVYLGHCMSNPRDPTGSSACTPKNASRAAFLDGGVFDNQPLGLAARLAGDGLRESSVRASFIAPLRRNNNAPPADALFVYVDPELTSYPVQETTDAVKAYSAKSLMAHYVGIFISSARAKELASVFEGSPEMREKLVIATVDTPPVSQSLLAFFGFFDANIRMFDFYLGMRAARRLLDGALLQSVIRLRGKGPALGHYEDVATVNMEPYRCIRAVLDKEGDPQQLCKAMSADMRAAFQTSLAKLVDRCAQLLTERDALPGGSSECTSAMRHQDPQRVPFVPVMRPGFHRRGDAEPELSYVVRLLTGYGFRFRDIGLHDETGPEVERAIHAQFRVLLEAFSAAQPESRALVDVLSRTLIGQLDYVPASVLLHASLGSVLEGGASFRLGAGPTRFLRATAAVNAGGLTNFSGAGGATFTLAPMGGFEAEILALSGQNLQPRIGARAGYLFSSADGFLAGTCATPDRRLCSRFTAQAYVAVSLVERIRVQLAFAMLPAVRAGEAFTWSILPTTGVQFVWP
jgi:predicted acylesterase/phospholipase RssA